MTGPERPNRASAALAALPWLAIIAATLLVVALSPRDPAARVAVAQVRVAETTLPPCGPALRRVRRVAMATAYLPRHEATRVARVRIEDGGLTWTAEREAGLCRVRAPDGSASDEPCMLESCEDGFCAVRVPYVPRPGASPSPRLEFADAGGRVLGAGGAVAGPEPPESLPALAVRRDGRVLTVEAPGMPEGAARATVTRGGKAVADSPLNLDARGRATLTVPQGFDGVMISVAEGGAPGRGVGQSTVHVEGPFDGSCGSGG